MAEEEKVFKCYCGFKTTNIYTLLGHVLSVHGSPEAGEIKTEEKSLESEETEESKQTEAEEAEEKTEEKQLIIPKGMSEWVDFERNVFFCPFCNRNYKTARLWARHIKKHHLDEFLELYRQRGADSNDLENLKVYLDMISTGEYAHFDELVEK